MADRQLATLRRIAYMGAYHGPIDKRMARWLVRDGLVETHPEWSGCFRPTAAGWHRLKYEDNLPDDDG